MMGMIFRTCSGIMAGAGYSIVCTPGVSLAPIFAAGFPPAAHKFIQRTHRVRLINLCTADKKSSRKSEYQETPRVHKTVTGGNNEKSA